MEAKKKWKKIVKVFRNNIEEKNNDREISVITLLSCIACIWTIWENCTHEGSVSVCIMALCLCIVLGMGCLISRVFPGKKTLVKRMVTVVIGVIFTCLAMGGYNEGMALFGCLVVPGAVMLAIGLLEGTVLAAYFMLLIIAICWTPLRHCVQNEYAQNIREYFPVLFLLCTVIALYTNYKLREAKLYQMWEKERLQVSVEEERRKIGKITMQTISSISNAVDAKDSYTKEHSVRVAIYSKIIANELHWSKREQEYIYNMGLLHDIGKIGVPDMILKKHGQLTDEEFPEIQKHPVIGGTILKDFTLMEDVSIGAFYHHERYDGTGYPFGLKGEEIPVEARIIGIADSIDAMNSDRVYRGKKDISYILEQLEAGKGTQFDPNIDEIVIALIKNNKLRLDLFEQSSTSTKKNKL